MAQLPEPNFGPCASVFYHLFAARSFRGELQGPGGPGGSQAKLQGRQFFQVGAERRKGNACLLLRERETGPQANPCENCLLGETRAGVQEPGPWVLSHEGANSTTASCPALWDRVVGRSGDSLEPGGHCPWEQTPTLPADSRNGQQLSPVSFFLLTPGPTTRGFCLLGF